MEILSRAKEDCSTMRDGTVVDVFLASPADMKEAREVVSSVISEWNGINARHFNVSYVVRRWETGLRSGVGHDLDAQRKINETLLRDSDLLIAVFGQTLGRDRGSSPDASLEKRFATVEELTRFMDASGEAWVYFQNTPVNLEDIDPSSLACVRKLQGHLQQNGVAFSVKSTEELRDRIKEDLNDHARRISRSQKIAHRLDDEKIEKLRWSQLSESEKSDLYSAFARLEPSHHLPLSPVAEEWVQESLEKRYPLDLKPLRRLVEYAGLDASRIIIPCNDNNLREVQSWRTQLIEFVVHSVMRGPSPKEKELFQEIYQYLKAPDKSLLASDEQVSSCDAILVLGSRREHVFRVDKAVELVHRSNAVVILSGNHPIYDAAQTLPIGEAEAMDYYLRKRLGTVSVETRLETRARTTLETFTHTLSDMTALRQQLGRPVKLVAVTAPYHMHRVLRQLAVFYETRRNIVGSFSGKLSTAGFDYNVFSDRPMPEADRVSGIGFYVQELMKLYGGRATGEF